VEPLGQPVPTLDIAQPTAEECGAKKRKEKKMAKGAKDDRDLLQELFLFSLCCILYDKRTRVKEVEGL
jgi:hypothetical protein